MVNSPAGSVYGAMDSGKQHWLCERGYNRQYSTVSVSRGIIGKVPLGRRCLGCKTRRRCMLCRHRAPDLGHIRLAGHTAPAQTPRSRDAWP
eukprot:3940286-Rhodomonas_salina.3